MTEPTNVPRCPCLYLYLKKIYVFTQTHPAVLGKAEEDMGSQKIRKFRVSIFTSESNSIKNCSVCFYFFLQVRIGSRLIPNLSGQGSGSQLGSHQPTLTRCPLCNFLPFHSAPSQHNSHNSMKLNANATCCWHCRSVPMSLGVPVTSAMFTGGAGFQKVWPRQRWIFILGWIQPGP